MEGDWVYVSEWERRREKGGEGKMGREREGKGSEREGKGERGRERKIPVYEIILQCTSHKFRYNTA